MEVTISVVVGADRRVVIDLPPTTPLGPADVTIRPSSGMHSSRRLTRESARSALLAAGLLTTPIPAPERSVSLSEEEIARIGALPAGARPSEALVADDRGYW